jgi:chemotaxis signal transduction protein
MEQISEIETSGGHDNSVPGAPARLIEYSRGRFVALPPHTTLELLEHPQALAVPGAAYYAYGLLAWQGRQLPLIDLEALLLAYAGGQRAKAPRYALVVAYQRAPGAPVEHGAIAMADLPQTVTVSDDAMCELPNGSDMWPLLALSCFTFDGQVVPVVDTGRLFSSYHG